MVTNSTCDLSYCDNFSKVLDGDIQEKRILQL